ncbi:MAG: Type 1 glutamine amidotransferase-like domain-containing protein [Candidatus Saccharimonadales bacterium]
MQQLLLASDGLGALTTFLSDTANTTSVALITNSMSPDPEKSSATRNKATLLKLGYSVTEIDIDVLDATAISPIITTSEVIFVPDGSMCYLLDRIKKSGLEHLLIEHLRMGKKYIGIGAGAVIAAQDIGPLITEADRAIAPLLESTKGLGLINFVPMPHYNNDTKYDYDDIIEAHQIVHKFITMTDEQAIIITSDGFRRIVESALI